MADIIDAATAPATTPPTPNGFDTAATYRVLARKYRPGHFGELIGQGPMVRTLRNAFAHERIPQAWMLTGVRGVGKTTTARILARALNYEADGVRKPTVEFSSPGVHCVAIMEGRHVDVIEMDAASHTSINDIREITDAARYKPVSSLYKVYIIDEVHMLSTAAFNGLLKTLEEPPAHVKFIFATTEIRKVPVTVLSRCQRFDLRRIEADELTGHLARVARSERITVDDEALRLIARAAEGSVRDSLSLLDQAIAHGGGAVSADSLRDMLGLADRSRVVDLFERVMRGDAAGALAELAAQYDVGADPAVVLADLAAFTHQVTRLKATGGTPDPGDPQEVRERSAQFAAGLGMAALSRMWQALTAGIAEVNAAPKPMMAAEMVLIRLTYMASLPDPATLALTQAPAASGAAASRTPSGNGSVGGGGRPRATRSEAQAISSEDRAAHGRAPAQGSPRAAPGPSTPESAAPAAETRTPDGPVRPRPENLAEVAALMGEHSLRLKHAVERDVRLKRFERGRIEVTLNEGAAPGTAGALGQKLTEVTGERWIVTVSDGAAGPTLAETHQADQERLKAAAHQEPLVKALLERFPDAEVTSVRVNARDGAGDALPDGPGAMRAKDLKG